MIQAASCDACLRKLWKHESGNFKLLLRAMWVKEKAKQQRVLYRYWVNVLQHNTYKGPCIVYLMQDRRVFVPKTMQEYNENGCCIKNTMCLLLRHIKRFQLLGIMDDNETVTCVLCSLVSHMHISNIPLSRISRYLAERMKQAAMLALSIRLLLSIELSRSFPALTCSWCLTYMSWIMILARVSPPPPLPCKPSQGPLSQQMKFSLYWIS